MLVSMGMTWNHTIGMTLISQGPQSLHFLGCYAAWQASRDLRTLSGILSWVSTSPVQVCQGGPPKCAIAYTSSTPFSFS